LHRFGVTGRFHANIDRLTIPSKPLSNLIPRQWRPVGGAPEDRESGLGIGAGGAGADFGQGLLFADPLRDQGGQKLVQRGSVRLSQWIIAHHEVPSRLG
jgi:hypothetical protein